MKKPPSIQSIRRGNFFFHVFADGLIETGAGFFLIGFSALYIKNTHFRNIINNSPEFLNTTGSSAFPFGVTLFLILAALKKTVTHPRIGYVEFGGSWKLIINTALAFSAVIVLFVLFYLLQTVPHYAGKSLNRDILTNLLLVSSFSAGSAVFYFIAVNTGMKHYYFYVFLLPASGLLIRMADMYYITTAVLCFCGIISSVAGITTFVNFIRNNPRFDNPDQD